MRSETMPEQERDGGWNCGVTAAERWRRGGRIMRQMAWNASEAGLQEQAEAASAASWREHPGKSGTKDRRKRANDAFEIARTEPEQ